MTEVNWRERNRKQREKAEKERERGGKKGGKEEDEGGGRGGEPDPIYSGWRRKDTGFPRDRIFRPSF